MWMFGYSASRRELASMWMFGYSASRRELALFENSVRTAVTGFADQRLATRQTDQDFYNLPQN
jgi:hypothetical protein